MVLPFPSSYCFLLLFCWWCSGVFTYSASSTWIATIARLWFSSASTLVLRNPFFKQPLDWSFQHADMFTTPPAHNSSKSSSDSWNRTKIHNTTHEGFCDLALPFPPASFYASLLCAPHPRGPLQPPSVPHEPCCLQGQGCCAYRPLSTSPPPLFVDAPLYPHLNWFFVFN